MPPPAYIHLFSSRVRTVTLGLLTLLVLACAASPDPARYRLAESGSQWETVGEDRILHDVQRRYPEFFAVILDSTTSREPDLRPIREDIERQPTDRRNYDALNAIAIAYFELNARAEADRGGSNYLSDSFRSARLVAFPGARMVRWRTERCAMRSSTFSKTPRAARSFIQVLRPRALRESCPRSRGRKAMAHAVSGYAASSRRFKAGCRYPTPEDR